MKLRPEEITSILRERIENFDTESNLAEVGAVLQVGDGIARIHGLENCVALEMLELDHGVVGLAFNLEEDNVGAALFGDWEKVKEGEPVRRTGKVASVPVGDGLIGRIVADIEQKSGRPVQASRSVDPDLIGGIVLQAGSMRLDASVRGRLDRLRQELTVNR